MKIVPFTGIGQAVATISRSNDSQFLFESNAGTLINDWYQVAEALIEGGVNCIWDRTIPTENGDKGKARLTIKRAS
ncbi:MAG: hypothetical protein ACEQSA_06270 [Weeksellaceae bacterium]